MGGPEWEGVGGVGWAGVGEWEWEGDYRNVPWVGSSGSFLRGQQGRGDAAKPGEMQKLGGRRGWRVQQPAPQG